MYPKTIFLDENEEPPSGNAESSASRRPSQKTSQSFRNRFFPDATQEDWNDWRWQLQNRITSRELLGLIIRLSENEQNSFHFQSTTLPLAITPYYASLLDPDSYPGGEVSGTGFDCYAIAWGINNGILDKATYLPVVEKAWTGLNKCVGEDGHVGWVQPIGADPRKDFTAESWEVYGSGAYLLAGSEVIKLKR